MNVKQTDFFKKVSRSYGGDLLTKRKGRLKSMANVGNHLHLHLQLTNRHTYRAFIRAVTSAIMMTVTGASRWNKEALAKLRDARKKFWDRRPFSRIVSGFKAELRLRDYVYMNELESNGFKRDHARFYISWRPSDSS